MENTGDSQYSGVPFSGSSSLRLVFRGKISLEVSVFEVNYTNL